MDEQQKDGRLEDPRNRSQENVNQAKEAGAEVGRTGSTGSDIHAGEWKPGSEESRTSSDGETGSTGKEQK